MEPQALLRLHPRRSTLQLRAVRRLRSLQRHLQSRCRTRRLSTSGPNHRRTPCHGPRNPWRLSQLLGPQRRIFCHRSRRHPRPCHRGVVPAFSPPLRAHRSPPRFSPRPPQHLRRCPRSHLPSPPLPATGAGYVRPSLPTTTHHPSRVPAKHHPSPLHRKGLRIAFASWAARRGRVVHRTRPTSSTPRSNILLPCHPSCCAPLTGEIRAHSSKLPLPR